jgi:hypothetical protein
MPYSRRRLGLTRRTEERGDLKVLVEQYANLIEELAQPDDRDRLDVYLDAKDLVLDLAWAAILSADTKGTREALEELDDVRYLQRLARKRHSDS